MDGSPSAISFKPLLPLLASFGAETILNSKCTQHACIDYDNIAKARTYFGIFLGCVIPACPLYPLCTASNRPITFSPIKLAISVSPSSPIPIFIHTAVSPSLPSLFLTFPGANQQHSPVIALRRPPPPPPTQSRVHFLSLPSRPPISTSLSSFFLLCTVL